MIGPNEIKSCSLHLVFFDLLVGTKQLDLATAKQLDDITECPICTEVYTDPRVLPCVHTYCLKCIEAWSKDKQPGDKLACPMCRKEFIVPSNGVKDLPKNFIVANFLQMKELSSVESKKSPCEACSCGE